VEIRDHRAAPAEEAGPETQLTDDALDEGAPLSESSPEDIEEGVLEERRVPRVIPRV